MRPLIIIALCGFSAVSDDNISLINKGKADQAISNLKASLAQNPKDAKAHELMGLAYLRQNKLADAETEARTAAQMDPRSSSAQVAMARVAIAKQDFNGAAAALNKAGEMDSSNSEVGLYKGSLSLAKRDYKGAVDTLSSYVSSNPDEPFGHYYLGLAQYGLKKPDKTVEQFQRFLALAPDTPEAARVESLLRSIR